MSEAKVKQLINEKFGFQKNKMDIIDCCYRHTTGKLYWVDFNVCGILYSMVDEGVDEWVLKVRTHHGRIEFGLHGYCKNCKHCV